MATRITLESTSQGMQQLDYESGYAKKAIDLITNAGNENLNDPTVIAQLQQAYQFLQAIFNKGTFTDPQTGKTMDFSVYGQGGIFGKDAQKVQDALTKVLKSFGNATIPSPSGGTVKVMDATTGEQATLYDLIRPNDKFSFSYSGSNAHNSTSPHDPESVNSNSNTYTGSVNWCQQGNLPTASSGGCTNDTEDSNITKDANGNDIPGGGLHAEATAGSFWHGSNVDVTVSGNAAAIEGYITLSPTGVDASGSVTALDDALNTDM